MSMFTGAKNFVINGGTFVADAGGPLKGNLNLLLPAVARNAILNAGGRADEVRCYPGTREELTGKLEQWIDDKNLDRKRIMWLSGPAGAGKSAIFQTVAERCRDSGRHAVNFFFFSGDETRNRARPLVATLVYQLRRFYPSLDAPLTDYLTVDPLIYNAPVKEQFIRLISSPMQTISSQGSSSSHSIVIIIDGLDECDNQGDQENILSALHALVTADHSPFLVLVASRAEPHLVMSFNRLGNFVESVFLDDQYRPQEDIRLFVVAKFDEIKKNHHLARTLGKNWPAKADVDIIIRKSSGQFIYSATVMRFIQTSSESPALSLARVLEMRLPTAHNPLAHLDAFYSYIFSKARDIQAVRFIICIYFISITTNSFPFSMFAESLGYTGVEIMSFFADLGSIIQVDLDADEVIGLVFYHASLEDYLKDKSRSGVYHVVVEEISVELSIHFLQKFHDIGSLYKTIQILSHVQEPTTELSQSLMEASKRNLRLLDIGDTYHWELLICTIETLYLNRDKTLFKMILQRWVYFAYRNKINISRDIDQLSQSASWHYDQYRATEGDRIVRSWQTQETTNCIYLLEC